MTRRERERRRRRKRQYHPVKRVLLLGSVLAVAAIALGALGVVGYVLAVASEAPNINQLAPRLPGSESQIYAANGDLLATMSSDILRQPLTQSQQPQLLRKATVAVEDRRFWQHGGVDYEGLLRAALKDVFEGGGIQGGSTLTMQLVTNVYLPLADAKDHNLKYKIIQAKLANELESKHTKQWILTQYLNDVPYGAVNGQNAIGVGAASQMFFNEKVSQLKLYQIALLAGLPQAPTEDNPFTHPGNARWRRSIVLAAMVRSGYITQRQANIANHRPLGVEQNTTYDTVQQPYVVQYAEQQLQQDMDNAGEEQALDAGGLKVYTTINLADQAYAKEAIEENEGQPGDPASSLVAVDPANGHILALQNSTTYGTGPGQTEFSYATQGQRQTGSSFKAFVLMTLIHDDNGNPNETYYNSAPLAAGWLPSDPTWAVQNASESDAQGVISVTKATTLSINAVYAQLGVDVGMHNVDAMAHAMGITTKLFGYPAEAIGGLKIGVDTLQMSDAYATIANGGSHITPTIISKVEVPLPDGGYKTLNFGDPKKTQVFTQGQAYAATQVLQSVIQYGTGTAANYGCPAAGKTGTTSSYTDAWFVGYTPELSTAVWVGYPNASTSMTDVNGLGPGYGGTLAAPIWHDFMEKASDGFCGSFPTPSQYWYGEPYFGAHASSPPVQTTTTSTNTTTTGSTTTPGQTTTPVNSSGHAGQNNGTTGGSGVGTIAAPPPVTTAPIYGNPQSPTSGNSGGNGT